MTIPAAPQTADGEALLYLLDDNGGTNRANLLRGLGSTTINAERVAHAAVASHLVADAHGATPPVILVAASDGTIVRALLVTAAGALVDASQLVDNAAFADGTSRVSMAGFVFDEVAGAALTENDAGAARMDAKRALVASIEDPTTRGRKATVTTSGGLVIEGVLLDNAAFADGATRVLPAGFVFDEVAGTALTENDVAAARIDSKRAVVGVIEDPATRGRKATVDADGSLMVRPSKQGSLTDRSGSITAGGASQQLAAALATRRYLLVQNNSAEVLWVNFGTAAVGDQPSVSIPIAGTFVMDGGFVDTQAVNIIGATTGSKFTAKEA